jgi:hypothetical protein
MARIHESPPLMVPLVVLAGCLLLAVIGVPAALGGSNH